MDQPGYDRLTASEAAVLWLAADHANGEIATVLGIKSTETVKSHLANARSKLGGVERKAASRGLRALIPSPPPWVSPPQVMGGRVPDTASVLTVQEPRATFDPSAFVQAPEPAIEVARFADRSAAARIELIATATLNVAVAVLIMLAVSVGFWIVFGRYFGVPFNP
jgi:DNA-binding CsgD family transcriptional regulator